MFNLFIGIFLNRFFYLFFTGEPGLSGTPGVPGFQGLKGQQGMQGTFCIFTFVI